MGVTRARWGVPSCVTVTAGVGHAGLLAEAEPEEFDRVMRVNARGPWLCMRAWVGALREQGLAGSFVAVSSVSARLVDRNMGLYCASKAALSMLVQVAAAEWGELGIRVNAVAPGVTRTPMLGRGPSATVEGSPWLAGVAERTALGRLGEAGDIAQTIIALHTMDWVTGQVLECDGGLVAAQPGRPLWRHVAGASSPGCPGCRGCRFLKLPGAGSGALRAQPVAHDGQQIAGRVQHRRARSPGTSRRRARPPRWA